MRNNAAIQQTANTSVQVGPQPYEVVISVAGEESALAEDIKNVLEGRGVKRIYFYKKAPGVQLSEQIKKDWEEACQGCLFFIILYSNDYEASEYCQFEYDHIIHLLFPAEPHNMGNPSSDGLLPWALVSLGKKPKAKGGFTQAHHYHRGYDQNKKVDRESIVIFVLTKIARTTLLEVADPRCRLLEFWNEPASKRWPDVLKSLKRRDSEEIELVESNVALAASVGFGEQLGRALTVVHQLNDLQLASVVFKDGRSNSASMVNRKRLMTRGIRALLFLFNMSPQRRYGSDSRDSDVELLKRLQGYLSRHTMGGRDEDAEEFVSALEDLLTWTKSRVALIPKIQECIDYIQFSSGDFAEELTRRLPKDAQQYSRITGQSNELISGLDRFSLSVGTRLQRKA